MDFLRAAPWFRAFCAAAILALLWTAYRVRVQKLRREENKPRDVIETMPTFAWTALPDGAVDFVNRHWLEYRGRSAEQTAGSGWEAAVDPADLRRLVEEWQASLATGELFKNEVRYRGIADGQYRWFLARAVLLRDTRGKILKWYGISTDVEDLKRVEEALRSPASVFDFDEILLAQTNPRDKWAYPRLALLERGSRTQTYNGFLKRPFP